MTYSIELITAVAGLLVASNVAVGAVTRWLITRSAERRDVLTQVREAYQLALERVAKVEGRADELSRQNQHLQDQRVTYTQQIARLEMRVAQLEGELADARAEADELRGRVRGRSTTPATPIPAQPDTTNDAPPRR